MPTGLLWSSPRRSALWPGPLNISSPTLPLHSEHAAAQRGEATYPQPHSKRWPRPELSLVTATPRRRPARGRPIPPPPSVTSERKSSKDVNTVVSCVWARGRSVMCGLLGGSVCIYFLNFDSDAIELVCITFFKKEN